MIKYNNNNINDWNFGDDNIIKVYYDNAVCYYKVISSGGTTAQTPCFAVVDDINQYQETEFEDVYDKATEKWYKLNNLNQYEEYGVYASGRTLCEGSTSRLPQGYTEVEYIQNTSTAYIDTGAYLNTSNFEIGYTIVNKQQLFGYCHQGCGNCTWLGVEQSAIMFWGNNNNNANISSYLTSGDNTIIFTPSGATINGTSISKTLTIGSDDIRNISLLIFARYDFKNNVIEHRTDSYMQLKSFYLKNNGTLVRDFVPCKRDSDDKYGMYDIVNDVFYVSPNNVDFIGGEPITPTDCVTTYNGKLTIDDGYEYIYSGGSWVNVGEVSGGTATLPNVPFVLNYNAKDYDANTHTISKTSGQTKEVDAVCTYNTNNVVDHSSDGYISITGNTRFVISGGTTSLIRTNTETGCTMTIVSKVKTSSGYSILTSRGGTTSSEMHWMWRYLTNGIFLHGSSSYNTVTYSVNTTSEPVTASVRVNWNNGVQQVLNDWTNNGSYSGAFQYGSSSSINNDGSLFCDYLTANMEFWEGDFYWVYMSQSTLTDEQVQQVIDYNKDNGGTTIYPLEYTVKSDPPDNLTFNTMAEALAYECPWVGMTATIDGTAYMFCESNEWLTKYSYVEVTGDYLCENGNKYKKMQEYVRQADGTLTPTSNYVKGDLIEEGSSDCSYKQYEYIMSETGSKHYTYNTLFYPTTAHTIEIRLELTGQSLDWGRILGWSNCNCDTSEGQFRFSTVTNKYQIIARAGATGGTSYRPTIGTGLPLTVTLPLSATSGTYNSGGTDITLNYNYNSSFPNNLPYIVPLHFFTFGYSEDPRFAANCKIYYVKVWNGSTLVKHYVASSYNGSPCFYEKVNGEYITNTYSGSSGGTCTLGPEITS